MSIDLNTPPATSITIQPQARTEAKPYEYKTGKKVAATEAEFLGHEGGFNFSDLLDVINPLQHIPIISTIYRAATGDEISSGAKMLGGGLLGGITGLLASAVDEIVKTKTGTGTGEKIYSALVGDSISKTAKTLDTAETTSNETDADMAAMGTSLAASAAAESVESSRALLASVREANILMSQNPSAANPVQRAADKYRQAQTLAWLQLPSPMASESGKEAPSAQAPRQKDDRDRETDALNARDPLYRDWLSDL